MPRPTDLDGALAQLARGLRRGFFARELARLAGGGLFAAGCAALLARASFDPSAGWAALLFVPLLAVPPLAARRARARTPARAELAAWLDRRGGGSGALVTALEAGDPAWKERLEAPLAAVWAAEAGRARVPWRTLAARLLPALAFAALALHVPLPAPATPRANDALATRLAEDVRAKLEALTETVTLEERIAEELAARLARLEEGLGEAGESFLEAADSLAERLESLARRADEEVESTRAALEGARRGELAAGAEAQAAGAADLARALAQATEELRAGGLERLLPEGLRGLELPPAEAPPGLQLDPETLARLAEELSEALARGLEGLRAAGLLDPERLRRPEELRPLSELLAQHHTCDDSCRQGGT